MKSKIIRTVAAGVFMSLALCACEKTPEDVIVRQKGQAQNEAANAESGTAAEKESSLYQTLGAETHYTSSSGNDTGLKIQVDADVKLPDVSAIPTYEVSARPFDQEWIDKVTETFLPGGKAYDAEEYFQLTKAECKERLDMLKEALAAGNMDPYNYGKDEDGNYLYDINEEIASMENQYNEAPKEKTYTEITPMLSDENTFMGMVEMPDQSVYKYNMKEYEGMEIHIQRVSDETERSVSPDYSWIDYEMMVGFEEEEGALQPPSEEEVRDMAGISFDEAKKVADEKVQALGIEGMEVGCSDYAVRRVDVSAEQDGGTMKVTNAGYHFIYERIVQGVPIISTMEIGGALQNMEDDVTKPWIYETLDIIVNGEGLQEVNITSIYDIGDKTADSTTLMSFPEIMKIFDNMMQVSHAEAMDGMLEDIFSIDRITLGYMRIYQPDSGDQKGTLIPVWDFFGGESTRVEYEGREMKSNTYAKNNSYMTINAVDGTVIDRGLGY
ncbi:MAG: DUF6034 family protein [Lachnospiraceae bacterium]|nr:DUF6034 family protein [Lachnospiraceae bacterium]